MTGFSFDAVIFDLDGVITKTALVHAEAWKYVFDEYLKWREKEYNEKFKEFTYEKDYLPYVDGIPRYEGVKAFLDSRGIQLSYGNSTDAPAEGTICGIGNRKNLKFLDLLEKNNVEVYPSTIELIKTLRVKQIKIGVASSSRNCKYILKRAGIEGLIDERIDGEVSDFLHLRGKPCPDIFIFATTKLKTDPERSVVVEDATKGVKAAKDGGFGLVIGVARKNNAEELKHSGADVVVEDLKEVDFALIECWFSKR